MNREIKPDTEGQRPVDEDGAPRQAGGSSAMPAEPAKGGEPAPRARASSGEAGKAAGPPPGPARPARTSPRTYLREVRGELRRVAWPSGKELRSYSLVVLVTVTILMFYVFLLDQAIGQAVFQIFG